MSLPLDVRVIRGAAVHKPKQVSELGRARSLGLVAAVKGGPRDVAERHSQYLRARLRLVRDVLVDTGSGDRMIRDDHELAVTRERARRNGPT